MKQVYVLIRLALKDGADKQDVISEMGYELTHDEILETEVCEVFDEYPTGKEK